MEIGTSNADPCYTVAACDGFLQTFNSAASSQYVLIISDYEPSSMNKMKMSLKPCVACNKDYDAKLLHDGVCEKCLAAVVIKKWLRADG